MLLPKYLRRFMLPMTFSMVPDEGGGDGGGSGGAGGNAGAGNAGDAGGAGGNTGGSQGGGQTDKEKADVVARADHERALADMQKYKAKAAKLEQERQAAAEARMKEQNQFKELAELKEKEANDAKAEALALKNSFLNERKYSAVKSKCEALGLRPEALSDLEMLDLESVQIETTSTGKINVLNADKFAERLKTLKPHWFADKSAPNVTTTSPRTHDSGGVITPQDIVAAEREGRKAGDLSKYYDLQKRYLQQRQSAR